MAGVYTVKQVNSYIKNMFKQDFLLNSVSVKGEISNCKYHTSGHIYFTLKDADAALSVIMFASQAAKLAFKLKDGMSVVVSGRVDVFDAAGKYQLYANTVQQEGIGELYQKFEQLKQYYEDMGYFAKEYKRPLPAFTRKLGVVTSKTGAAVQDIMNISKRRNPYIQIVLYPAYVQGEHAKQSIVSGITRLDKMWLDCIIVGRGGGSIEDLWAFNEPEVVEAVFNASTPIISAVGHETDFTIADFVADLRAPTPSAAAELAVFDYKSIVDAVDSSRERLHRAMWGKLQLLKSRLDQYQVRMQYLNPQGRLRDRQQYAADMEERLYKGMEAKLREKRNLLALYLEKYAGLSPLRKLNQGYSYVTDIQGHAVTSIEGIREKDRLFIAVTDGRVETEVIGTNKEGPWLK